jgi:hypothetical protein
VLVYVSIASWTVTPLLIASIRRVANQCLTPRNGLNHCKELAFQNTAVIRRNMPAIHAGGEQLLV